VSFDVSRLQVTGAATRLPESTLQNAVTGSSQFQVAADGSIVYVPSTERLPDGALLWVDRSGDARPASDARRPYYAPAISPDGQNVAITAAEGANRDIWILNVSRGSMTRLTFEPALDAWPIWTRDGKRVAFSSSRAGARNLFWVAADGSTPADRLTTSSNTQLPGSWTKDGALLIYEEADPTTGWDLWMLPMAGGVPGQPKVLLQTSFSERLPRLSPDGAWLAYVSDESGRQEIFVRAFPGPGGKTQVSTNGGSQPVWSASGRELYFRLDDKVMSVQVTTAPTFKAGRPQLLFARDYDLGPSEGIDFDVAPDGTRFLMVKGSDPLVSAAQLNVVLGWAEHLNNGSTTTKK
jgi:Tol biopolymer transport system component